MTGTTKVEREIEHLARRALDHGERENDLRLALQRGIDRWYKDCRRSGTMTRDEQIARAYGLRYVAGWKQQRIADDLGVTLGTVSRWLDPDGTRANNKRAKAKRTSASRQGEYVKRRAAGRVAQRERCEVVEIDKVIAERESHDDEVYQAWHRMLRDGSSVADVAKLLGIGKPVLLQHVQQLREDGRDLPYRHQVAA